MSKTNTEKCLDCETTEAEEYYRNKTSESVLCGACYSKHIEMHPEQKQYWEVL